MTRPALVVSYLHPTRRSVSCQASSQSSYKHKPPSSLLLLLLLFVLAPRPRPLLWSRTHASLPPSAHCPPRQHIYTVHRSLAQHPWVLRPTSEHFQGKSSAPNLSLDERTLLDHMPADLSTHTTLPSHRPPRLVSALTSTSEVCDYNPLD